MAEYIEREMAYDTLTEYYHHSTDTQHEALREVLSRVPTADVAPVVRGRWVDGKCDNCGEHAPYWCLATTFHESNYCPNCGAEMEVQDG